jgi:hypothetical protein
MDGVGHVVGDAGEDMVGVNRGESVLVGAWDGSRFDGGVALILSASLDIKNRTHWK